MSSFFLKIINMSISAGWLVLAVLVLRIILKKAPKWVHMLLWGMVAVRLICPISLESVLSLIPSAETLPEEVISGPSFEVQTGVAVVDDRVNDYLDDRYFEGVTVPANNGFHVMSVLSLIWLAGMAVLLLYAWFSYRRLQRKVETAVLFRDNIYQSEYVASPFVLGIIQPRIYLSFQIDATDLEHVVAHEQAHICRRDHWWKPLGFLLLAIHWFNPLIWLAYVLLCRDIELACDEKVIKKLNQEQRADYTQALLTCSVNHRQISACPLAFGEVGVKERVKSVLNYKTPGFRVSVLAVAACIIVAVCFLTNPKEELFHAPEPFCHSYRVEEILYDAPQFSFTYRTETAPGYQFTSDYAMFETENALAEGESVSGWVQRHGAFKEVKLTAQNFDNYFKEVDNVSGWRSSNITGAQLRKSIKRAWRINIENEENNVFYYLLLAKNDEVYLTYGYDADGDNEAEEGSLIRWLFKLARTDILSVNAISEDCKADIGPGYYPDGFAWEYEDLAVGHINGSGKLVIQTSLDVDTLTIREDYYRKYENATVVEKETYELSRTPDGTFELEVALRGDQEEEAVYLVRANEGMYVFRVVFGTEEAPLTGPQATTKMDEQEILNALANYYKEELPASAADPHVLFADATSGMIVFGTGITTLVYTTKDGGTTWEQTEIPEAGTTWHAAVTCAAAISATEYCVGYRYWGNYDGAFYLTRDSGKSWTRLTPEAAISEEITSNMRYAEAADVYYENGRLVAQVSCKTESGNPWSIEVKLASEDFGDTWQVVETWEKATDAE